MSHGLSPMLFVGLAVLVVAALGWLGRDAIGARIPKLGQWLGSLRLPLVFVGVVLAVSGLLDQPATPDAAKPNPVPRTVQSVELGRQVYAQSCAACHGADGRGGGPLSGTTAVRPPAFVGGHLGPHSDGDLYYWISNGLPGGMPAWADQLSETEIWHVVNFLRSLDGQPVMSDAPQSSGDEP